jgi:hypothetical protein
VLRRLTAQQVEGVGEYVQDRLEALDGPGGRSSRIDDQRPADGAGPTPRKTAQRIRRPHRLSEAGGLAIEHFQRRLGGQVALGESRPPGRNDEAGDVHGELTQDRGHRFDPVGHHSPIDDPEAGVLET